MSAKQFRIVSLVPSLTETICDLGLQKNLVGCTNFCISPKGLHKTAQIVGGTKDASIEKIISLKPTHILVNTEENLSSTIESLKKNIPHSTIFETFPKTPHQSLVMVKQIAHLFAQESKFETWEKETQQILSSLKTFNIKKSYVYFIWRDPWMVAGNQTYISEMLSLIGLTNQVLTSELPHERYPTIKPTDPKVTQSDYFLFSSEPFPFKKRHAEEFIKHSSCNAKSFFIDGQMLSWYGTRTQKALHYLKEMAHSIANMSNNLSI